MWTLNIMTRIFTSLFIMIAAAAVIVGGTYAWQIQTDEITGITYSAGSADLKIDSDPSSTNHTWVDGFDTHGAFDQENLEPGGEIGEQIIDVQNTAGAGGTLSMQIDVTVNDENVCIDPEVEANDQGDLEGELPQNLRIRVSFDANNDGNFDVKYNKTLAEWDALELKTLGDMVNTSGIASVKVEWWVPGSAGNEIMTDKVGMNIVFGLE